MEVTYEGETYELVQDGIYSCDACCFDTLEHRFKCSQPLELDCNSKGPYYHWEKK